VRVWLPVLALALLGCPSAPREPPPTSPAGPGNGFNVLLITIDTLRADHMGTYGYDRETSPAMDALGREGTVFEQAYTYWPKTRGSFVVMFTGRYPSRNGYSKHHPRLLDFNPTLASVLEAAGYRTAAAVDNPNVAARLGYRKGFGTYRETWEESDLVTEMDRSRAITGEGVRFLREHSGARPFFLWLHYVNPHAPYTPPPPYDTAFLDAGADSGPRLPTVPGFLGGIPERWAVPGRDNLGYYVAQYDGEIAAVDEEVGKVLDALRVSGAWDRTVIVLTSDHGESLGEHDYYFDHGQYLFDPSLRIPLLIVVPDGGRGRRCDVMCSTLDLVPTVLDAVQVSYPPGLDGVTLTPFAKGEAGSRRERLFAQNDRNLSASWSRRLKVVATPLEAGRRFALFDRSQDPEETRDVAADRPELAAQRRTLESFLEARDREWAHTRNLSEGHPGDVRMSLEACQKLLALGYVDECE